MNYSSILSTTSMDQSGRSVTPSSSLPTATPAAPANQQQSAGSTPTVVKLRDTLDFLQKVTQQLQARADERLNCLRYGIKQQGLRLFLTATSGAGGAPHGKSIDGVGLPQQRDRREDLVVQLLTQVTNTCLRQDRKPRVRLSLLPVEEGADPLVEVSSMGDKTIVTPDHKPERKAVCRRWDQRMREQDGDGLVKQEKGIKAPAVSSCPHELVAASAYHYVASLPASLEPTPTTQPLMAPIMVQMPLPWSPQTMHFAPAAPSAAAAAGFGPFTGFWPPLLKPLATALHSANDSGAPAAAAAQDRSTDAQQCTIPDPVPVGGKGAPADESLPAMRQEQQIGTATGAASAKQPAGEKKHVRHERREEHLGSAPGAAQQGVKDPRSSANAIPQRSSMAEDGEDTLSRGGEGEQERPSKPAGSREAADSDAQGEWWVGERDDGTTVYTNRATGEVSKEPPGLKCRQNPQPAKIPWYSLPKKRSRRRAKTDLPRAADDWTETGGRCDPLSVADAAATGANRIPLRPREQSPSRRCRPKVDRMRSRSPLPRRRVKQGQGAKDARSSADAKPEPRHTTGDGEPFLSRGEESPRWGDLPPEPPEKPLRPRPNARYPRAADVKTEPGVTVTGADPIPLRPVSPASTLGEKTRLGEKHEDVDVGTPAHGREERGVCPSGSAAQWAVDKCAATDTDQQQQQEEEEEDKHQKGHEQQHHDGGDGSEEGIDELWHGPGVQREDFEIHHQQAAPDVAMQRDDNDGCSREGQHDRCGIGAEPPAAVAEMLPMQMNQSMEAADSLHCKETKEEIADNGPTHDPAPPPLRPQRENEEAEVPGSHVALPADHVAPSGIDEHVGQLHTDKAPSDQRMSDSGVEGEGEKVSAKGHHHEGPSPTSTGTGDVSSSTNGDATKGGGASRVNGVVAKGGAGHAAPTSSKATSKAGSVKKHKTSNVSFDPTGSASAPGLTSSLSASRAQPPPPPLNAAAQTKGRSEDGKPLAPLACFRGLAGFSSKAPKPPRTIPLTPSLARSPAKRVPKQKGQKEGHKLQQASVAEPSSSAAAPPPPPAASNKQHHPQPQPKPPRCESALKHPQPISRLHMGMGGGQADSDDEPIANRPKGRRLTARPDRYTPDKAASHREDGQGGAAAEHRDVEMADRQVDDKAACPRPQRLSAVDKMAAERHKGGCSAAEVETKVAAITPEKPEGDDGLNPEDSHIGGSQLEVSVDSKASIVGPSTSRRSPVPLEADFEATLKTKRDTDAAFAGLEVSYARSDSREDAFTVTVGTFDDGSRERFYVQADVVRRGSWGFSDIMKKVCRAVGLHGRPPDLAFYEFVKDPSGRRLLQGKKQANKSKTDQVGQLDGPGVSRQHPHYLPAHPKRKPLERAGVSSPPIAVAGSVDGHVGRRGLAATPSEQENECREIWRALCTPGKGRDPGAYQRLKKMAVFSRNVYSQHDQAVRVRVGPFVQDTGIDLYVEGEMFRSQLSRRTRSSQANGGWQLSPWLLPDKLRMVDERGAQLLDNPPPGASVVTAVRDGATIHIIRDDCLKDVSDVSHSERRTDKSPSAQHDPSTLLSATLTSESAKLPSAPAGMAASAAPSAPLVGDGWGMVVDGVSLGKRKAHEPPVAEGEGECRSTKVHKTDDGGVAVDGSGDVAAACVKKVALEELDVADVKLALEKLFENDPKLLRILVEKLEEQAIDGAALAGTTEEDWKNLWGASLKMGPRIKLRQWVKSARLHGVEVPQSSASKDNNTAMQ
ncbi:unnamed protein product [Vitrella brassicaformis CCMP3155]|uniref:Uncharacterized protein n=1 Tax=Vitrella brassicaformis (strain CCMP3155) TaxID=1169540 RepID=A0A0G4H6U6_VITBC|nr:unnamed protein product [Vitrella brassicaformis CCMP3155]|eukprot:CEM39531.1 unnamed protein product [Vitrella brassicaformis CCMP3155]